MGDYWTLTVDILQAGDSPLVAKPKLTEKLLTKPPFRFLHDVITAVQASSGFAPGLFEGVETDAKKIEDKEAKVAYLTKIIDVVAIVLGQSVPAKPLKIVAGLEPENTNVFLQMLGSACKLSDGKAAVQKVLGGGSAPAAAPKAAEPARPTSRPSSQLQPEQEEAAPPPAAKAKKAAPAAAPEKAAAAAPAAKKEKSSSKPAPEPAAPPKLARADSKTRSSKTDAAAEPAPRAASPTDDGGKKALARPQSARKGPPKPAAAAGPAAAAPAAAAPAAAAPPAARGGAGSKPLPDARAAQGVGRPVALLEEGARGDSDDDVEVVHEAAPIAVGASRGPGEQGVLVKNILDAQKDLKKTGKDTSAADAGGGTGIILKRAGKGTAAAAGAAGSAVAGGAIRPQDTNAIRDLVQKLCQSSHPLAKSMDYMQEDLENMAKEYRFWQTEKRMFADKLNMEQRQASDSTASEALLADLDGQIKQARDRIIGVKGQILRNDETVSKLLAMAVGAAVGRQYCTLPCVV